ncbi:hypothetical protein SAMN05660477_02579 [Soonwooa buanensis]|uniref:Lipoprotein n=1 Tax=Soonwooa buanensis TaxID=619805 RepID=A0A1T5G5Y5_9FLAO|nr:hypothetical protein [Soonwooa buanensis]SKC03903.1 hypothetical protein SAMN05660477_02579 [Soonwooa buanensis]
MKLRYISIFSIVVLFSCKKEKQNLTESKTKNDSIRIQKVEDTLVDILPKPIPPIVEPEELNDDERNTFGVSLSRKDSTMYLTSNIQHDHRIFGYAKPNIKSEKLILFSVFTDEVENNPSKCRFGSYYEMPHNSNKFSLKYKNKTKDFVHAILTDSLNKKHDVYFEKEWVKFD